MVKLHRCDHPVMMKTVENVV